MVTACGQVSGQKKEELLQGIIHKTSDPEKAAEIAITIILDFLKQPQSSVKPCPDFQEAQGEKV